MSSVVPSEKKLTEEQLEELSIDFSIRINLIKTFCAIEGNNIGFGRDTGKIVIQFEPHLYKRENKDWEKEKGIWINNGVSNQIKEWAAFHDAYSKDAHAAMMATSIGEMQVLGMNFRRCGFSDVGAMWAYNEISERNQVETGLRYIKADPICYQALIKGQFTTVAERYNGKGFRALAIKLGIVPYDIQMANTLAKLDFADHVHKTTTTVNIRTGAGVQYPIIQALRVGTIVTVEGQYNGWNSVKVVATRQQGWVNSAYIK